MHHLTWVWTDEIPEFQIKCMETLSNVGHPHLVSLHFNFPDNRNETGDIAYIPTIHPAVKLEPLFARLHYTLPRLSRFIIELSSVDSKIFPLLATFGDNIREVVISGQYTKPVMLQGRRSFRWVKKRRFMRVC